MRLLALLLLLVASTPAAAQPANGQSVAQATQVGADVEALIRVLENDEARGQLIERMRAAIPEAQRDESSPQTAPEMTILDRITAYTGSAVEGSAELIGTIVRLADHLGAVVSGAATVSVSGLWNSVRSVLLVVTVTFAAYFMLRLAFRRFQRVLAGAAQGTSTIRRAGIIGLSAGADLLTVLGAWVTGYLPALYAGVQAGSSQTLFLNAFLFIELAKVAARVLLAPRWTTLRLGRIDDTTAAYWYFWLSRLVSAIGYTLFFVAPLLAANVSGSAAEAIRIFVLFCALAMAWVIILQNRDAVRARLGRYVERGEAEPLVRMLSGLATFWHIAAIGYLTLIFVLWLANREAALPFVLLATVQSFVAMVIGVGLSVVVVRVATGGMHLPADIKARLPLLEQRLNAFVPNVLRVIRGIVMITVVLAIAQIWRLADFVGWLSSEFGQRVVTSVIAAFLILLAGGLVHLAVQSWVEYRLNPPYDRMPSPRERTLLGLFRNAFTIVFSIVILLLVLTQLGVNVGPLLAGAGIIGLAVGFGSQKLVQDVINGAFIQFENAMNEGDMVTVGGITGIVERLTIRSVSLRTVDGAYHLIPFSSVESVSNFMRNFSYHVAAIGVSYGANISDVKQAMQHAFERLKETEFGEHIIDDLEMHGVTEFADSAVVVRARIKTKAGQQWTLGRAYNEILKEVFDERGIEIPFPQVTLHLPEGKTLPPAQATRAVEASRTGEKSRKRNADGAAHKRQRRSKVAQDEPADESHGSLEEAEV